MTVKGTATDGAFKLYAIEKYHPNEEPFYLPISDEVELFSAAFKQRIPVLLKGPTGVGKTRFVEYMAWKMGRPLTIVKKGSPEDGKQDEIAEALPLVTVALLSLSFPQTNQWPPLAVPVLAYVGLVPWLAMLCRPSRRRVLPLLASYLAGVAFFTINARWLFHVTPPGAVALYFSVISP